LGLGPTLQEALQDRHYEFEVERAVYLTVLHGGIGVTSKHCYISVDEKRSERVCRRRGQTMAQQVLRSMQVLVLTFEEIGDVVKHLIRIKMAGAGAEGSHHPTRR
jgi:hypothetical protein